MGQLRQDRSQFDSFGTAGRYLPVRYDPPTVSRVGLASRLAFSAALPRPGIRAKNGSASDFDDATTTRTKVSVKSRPAQPRRGTSTSNFGVGKRESHDATTFYERFPSPIISNDDQVTPAGDGKDRIWVGDARDMDAASGGQLADNSVALVVTSPPYFAGKAYEEALGEGHIPAGYVEYLQMLTDVFGECVRKLEPGGRIAVNVANLGRKPYRSLSADVTTILQDELGLLLRGEVIWRKAAGAGGNCAWGSFRSPANPVLRDTTERLIIASKGRFDRALSAARRERLGLPSTADISVDEFMEATLDVWDLPAESATRVGHPAPFPVDLPQRCIRLFTYEGDLVLDPFMGSGTTAVAAVRTGRHFAGFDTEPEYAAAALARIEGERAATQCEATEGRSASGVTGRPSQSPAGSDRSVSTGSTTDNPSHHADRFAAAARSGIKATDLAEILAQAAGLSDLAAAVSVGHGLTVSWIGTTSSGQTVAIDVIGPHGSTTRSGLRRSDALWKAIAKASVAMTGTSDPRSRVRIDNWIIATTQLPAKPGPTSRALAALVGSGGPIAGVVDMSGEDPVTQLRDLLGVP